MSNSRFNITLSDELKAWYNEKSKAYGMSISALMVMVLAQHKEQQESVNIMSAIQKMYTELSATDLTNEAKKEILNNIAKDM